MQFQNLLEVSRVLSTVLQQLEAWLLFGGLWEVSWRAGGGGGSASACPTGPIPDSLGWGANVEGGSIMASLGG